ncbi:hypothetical protein EVAR_20460_1 [Eumeta japonica]|uniref:Uncharacterized protein n=1 Tax=Eumeta variegata TaxID=151549 RepID=A0A4C1TYD3_EUMVA|nr:hypothetical protein EVAR_20460_1 [Eumeta japonica]
MTKANSGSRRCWDVHLHHCISHPCTGKIVCQIKLHFLTKVEPPCPPKCNGQEFRLVMVYLRANGETSGPASPPQSEIKRSCKSVRRSVHKYAYVEESFWNDVFGTLSVGRMMSICIGTQSADEL